MSAILSRFSVLFLFFVSPFFLTSSAVGQTRADAVTVEFDRLWVDYDVTQDGLKGMLIHASFTVHGMLDTDGYLTVRIQDENDTALTSSNQSFRNKNGELAIFRSFRPAYSDAVYRDLSVFLPYQEIQLAGGTYNLELDADLIYENGDFIQHLILHGFTFTQPEQINAQPSGGITAKFDRMWIDYDITQGGEKGMLIHITFSVQKMKGVPGTVAYGFETAEGERLYTSNDQFRSKNGQLTIYKEITPSFDDSYYEDLQVFMPYREINVSEGSNELRVHVDVLHGDGGNIHLTYYEFTFTRTF